MSDILQSSAPHDIHNARALPGMMSLDMATWLQVDDAHAGQMALRDQLLTERRDEVLGLTPQGEAPAQELLEFVLAWLADHAPDYQVGEATVTRPDGVEVTILRDDPLGTLGQLVQEDLCLLVKHGEEHILAGAVVCFPASWSLEEKLGRPLSMIHTPVPTYTDRIAKLVQRAFDGVRVGRPFWRYNTLRYHTTELFQPKRRKQPDATGVYPFIRSERQCILRLPETEACVFSIHTYIVRDEPGVDQPEADQTA